MRKIDIISIEYENCRISTNLRFNIIDGKISLDWLNIVMSKQARKRFLYVPDKGHLKGSLSRSFVYRRNKPYF